jgi:hypothetical protein
MTRCSTVLPRVACYAPLLVFACASGSRAGGEHRVMRSPDAATRRVAERTTAGPELLGRLWTFEEPPLEEWKATYDFTPDARWLERVKLAAVRIGEYCSGAIVSPDGLVLTTQSCVRECITATSTRGSDDLTRGVNARSLQHERLCPGLYIDQLVGARDVTSEVRPAGGADGDQEGESARSAEIERSCASDPGRVCEISHLWNGARLRLYEYQRHASVKLVFAPELQVAHYGAGDDDLAWPRHTLDFAILRLYDSAGRSPARTPTHFVLRTAPPREDEPIFVAASPISTWRLATLSQFAYERDIRLPQNELLLQGLADILDAIDEDVEAMHAIRDNMFNVRGSLDITRGQLSALQDTLVAGARMSWENHVRARVAAVPQLHALYGDIWDRIAAIQQTKTRISPRLNATNMQIIGAPHLIYGADLRRYVRAMALPPAQRPSAYTAEYLERLEAFLTAETNVTEALARRFLGVHVAMAQEWIAPDDPIRTTLIEPREDVASTVERITRGSRLLDPAYRRSLLQGGPDALANTNDPLLRHALLLDSLHAVLSASWRALVQEEQHERRRLGEAVLAVFNTPIASDATFTPRLADGMVRTFRQNDANVPTYTTFYGLYERAQVFGADPSRALPESFRRRRQEVDLATPLDFIMTADALPSGGAVIDRDGLLTGIVVGTNRDHLANRFVFREGTGRAVAVHSAAVVEALASVYSADRIVRAIQIRKEKQ